MSEESTSLVQVKDLMPELTELLVADDPEGAQLAIVQRILSAPDAASALAPQRAVPAREVLGRPLRLERIRVAQSDYAGPDGPDVYALLDVVDLETGERRTVTCGGINVLAQLCVLHRHRALPAEVRIVESARPTRAGYRPLWLEAVERF
jgi:hypothetical protein